MLRKLGIGIASAITALVLVGQLYSFTARPTPNAWFVEQQNIVNQFGDAAPLSARTAVAFTKAPQRVINFIVPPADAQTQPQTDVIRPVLRDHVSVAQGSRPTVTGGTITSGSTDYRGRFTAPTTSAPVVTFGTAYLSAPWCDVTRSDGGSSVFISWTVSTTAITFASMTTGAGVVLNWRCDGVMQ